MTNSPLKYPESFDVIVVGGGNAALCSAITVARSSKKVLLIEKSAKETRGGNSKYTRDIRCCQHEDQFATGDYDESEFLEDILRVTGNTTNIDLAKFTVYESKEVPEWMEKQGVRWQKALHGTLGLSRTNRFFLGGGKALINTYYETARKLGVTVLYDTSVEQIDLSDNHFKSIQTRNDGSTGVISGNCLILCCGGFEANIGWLREYWGDAANNFVIRGSRNNEGTLLKVLLEKGAVSTGDPKQFHSVAVDARSPKFEGGIVTRIDSLPFGIVVNKDGKRFYDEGEELWPKRYAIWGKLIAEQPDQIAYSIFDSKVSSLFLPTVYPPFAGNTISEVATKVGLQSDFLNTQIIQFNKSIKTGTFNPELLDDCRTDGLNPPKSHWALPINTPPFYIYPLRPGITFTYMGLGVDTQSRVLSRESKVFDNVFAAGEIMAGNILTRGYLAGLGLTIGTVFGREAGENAALAA